MMNDHTGMGVSLASIRRSLTFFPRRSPLLISLPSCFLGLVSVYTDYREVVPGAGLEPARSYEQGILSP